MKMEMLFKCACYLGLFSDVITPTYLIIASCMTFVYGCHNVVTNVPISNLGKKRGCSHFKIFMFRAPENRPRPSTVHSTKSNFGSSMDDPFVVLESVSTSASTLGYDSSDIFSELEQISKLSNSGGAKPGISSNSSTKLKSPPKSAQASKGDKGFPPSSS